MKLKLEIPGVPKSISTIIIAVVVALVLILIGIISGDTGLLGNLIVISIFVVVIPIFLSRYARFSWIKAVEDQFPNFMRDLADSIRSGMSMKEAVKITTKGNYGKLTPEIKYLYNRLSWGTPLDRALEIFGRRTRDSKLIGESLNIVKEALDSGGNIAATFDAISRDLVQFKSIEADRHSMVQQHVMIMYGIFFMFLGIGIMIIFVMVPMIKSAPPVSSGGGIGPGGGMSFDDPCADVEYFPCNYFNALGVLFGLPAGITLYYTALLFTIVLVQGIFTGLIAGQLGENSVVAGTKHSLIMGTVALAVFLFVAKAGLLPV